MAKAYVLLQFDMDDMEAFNRYRQGAAPTILANGGRVLVAANAGELQEGAPPAEFVTIIEFPSREAAETWYGSPEYAAVKHFREDATSGGSLVFLDGFEPPVRIQ